MMAEDDMIYKKKGKFFIMKQQKDNSFYCFNDKKTYQSLNGFNPINKEILEK